MFGNDQDGSGVMVLNLSDLFGQKAQGLRYNYYHVHAEGHDPANPEAHSKLPTEIAFMVELPRNVTADGVKTKLEGPILNIEVTRPQTQDPAGKFCPDVVREISDKFYEQLPLVPGVKESDLDIKVDEAAGTLTVRCVITEEAKLAIEAEQKRQQDMVRQYIAAKTVPKGPLN